MLVHWIWLATRPMHDREKRLALEHFHDPEDIYFASADGYSHVPGLSEDAITALRDKDLLPAEQVLSDCARGKIHILTFRDGAYPARLKNISDPPMVLYYKGTLPDFDGMPVIGVVGTRKASLYGMTAAKRLGYQIGRCGGMVVSGAASGIDGVAMQGALTADAPVVGILGCGVDVVYPQSNKGLFADTERHGCLISEFVPGTPPYKWNFPKRNRIISGISDGVLVVEAPEKSGALITARQALEQGRDVFVVPGNIDVPSCAGSNALLRDGAIMVSSGWEVLSEYRHLYPDRIRRDNGPGRQTAYADEVAKQEFPGAKVAQKADIPRNGGEKAEPKKKKVIDNAETSAYSDGCEPIPNLNPSEQAIMDRLMEGECLVDDVIAATGLPSGQVLAALTMLEVKGVVKMLPGRRVAKK